jgi:tRNA pseudouridine55 synthase
LIPIDCDLFCSNALWSLPTYRGHGLKSETIVPSGILNINKPIGISSAKCVSIVKSKLHKQYKDALSHQPNIKIGHMGTLDPMGCGVLLIGVAKATRLFDWYLKHDKEYIADFVFGVHTDTLDTTGSVVDTTNIIPDIEQLRAVVPALLGSISQIPPQYSAKSVNGVRAYELARSGQTVQLSPSQVTVYSINILQQLEDNKYRLKIHCSSGTYIRSICRDMATMLGSLASMSYICRTRCDKYALQDSIDIDSIDIQDIIPLEHCVPNLPNIDIAGSQLAALNQGKPVYCEDKQGYHTITSHGLIVGIGYTQQSRLYIKTRLL